MKRVRGFRNTLKVGYSRYATSHSSTIAMSPSTVAASPSYGRLQRCNNGVNDGERARIVICVFVASYDATSACYGLSSSIGSISKTGVRHTTQPAPLVLSSLVETSVRNRPSGPMAMSTGTASSCDWSFLFWSFS